MRKHIDDCQTPDELAEAIAYHLKQGGMRRDIINGRTGTDIKKTVYDEFETKRLFGIALNNYGEIRKSYPKLPSIQIDTSDPLSGLALIQQLCYESGKADLPNKKPAETGGNVKVSKIMVTARTSKELWEAIKGEYDISKRDFGKKIKFVKGLFKRSVIFRDVEHAFVLASQGFSKPALILAGGVIEELLRLYLAHKNIKPKNKRFADYIKACEDNHLLKRGVSRLSDSIRDFRNLVHLDNEKTKRQTISKATAKGAVSSIFTIANDFQ